MPSRVSSEIVSWLTHSSSSPTPPALQSERRGEAEETENDDRLVSTEPSSGPLSWLTLSPSPLQHREKTAILLAGPTRSVRRGEDKEEEDAQPKVTVPRRASSAHRPELTLRAPLQHLERENAIDPQSERREEQEEEQTENDGAHSTIFRASSAQLTLPPPLLHPVKEHEGRSDDILFLSPHPSSSPSLDHEWTKDGTSEEQQTMIMTPHPSSLEG